MHKIRVLVVDSFPLVSSGVAAILRSLPEVEAVEEVSGRAEALAAIPRLRPTLLVAEPFPANDSNGPALCKTFKELPWPVRVLVYTGNTQPDGVVSALSMGADSYVHKSSDIEVLASAVRRTLSGERVWIVGDQPHRSVRDRIVGGALQPLTRRERQVLDLLLRRYTNEEIALELNLARQTAKNSVSAVLRKLGLKGRRELLHTARGQGWPSGALSPDHAEESYLRLSS
jgi:DNA-binding NarL/FixJ family response regulator